MGEERGDFAIGMRLQPEVSMTRSVKGCRAEVRENRVEFPDGSSVVMGKGDTKTVILPYRVIGNGLQALVEIFKVARIFPNVAFGANGDVVVLLFNSGSQSKLINQKLGLTGVLLFPGTKVNFEESVYQKLPLDVSRLEVEDWKRQFPKPFEQCGAYGTLRHILFFQNTKVCHKKVNWKMPVHDIHLSYGGSTYDAGDVTNVEDAQEVESLKKNGIISKLEVVEKGFFSPVELFKEDRVRRHQKGNLF